MKRNVGITDRIIRFVIVDLLLGASYLGIEIPPKLALVSFLLSLSLILTIIFGYSLIYQIFGISTRKAEAVKSPPNSKSETEPSS